MSYPISCFEPALGSAPTIALPVERVPIRTSSTRCHVVEEADEAVYWLELIHEDGFCKAPGLDALRREAAELSAIFNQSQLTAKSNSPWRRPSPGPLGRQAGRNPVQSPQSPGKFPISR